MGSRHMRGDSDSRGRARWRRLARTWLRAWAVLLPVAVVANVALLAGTGSAAAGLSKLGTLQIAANEQDATGAIAAFGSGREMYYSYAATDGSTHLSVYDLTSRVPRRLRDASLGAMSRGFGT